MSSTPSPNEELLSAYIDGELTEEERREVEAWLADDPRARALVDELQGVSTTLKSLPLEKLRRDLAAPVLARLADSTQAGGSAASSIPPSRFNGVARRGLWWSAAAIAAAVLIAMFAPNDPQRPVAHTSDRSPADPSPAPEMSAIQEDNAAPVSSDVVRTDEVFDSRATRSLPLVRAIPAPPAPEMRAPDDQEARLASPGPPGAVESPLVQSPSAPAPPALEPPAAAPPVAQLGDQVDGYLVVWVDVPADTLSDRAIDAHFQRNDIVVEQQIDQWSATAPPVRRLLESRSRDVAASPEQQQAYSQPGTRTFEKEETSASESGEQNYQYHGRLAIGDAILVEATADQLAACLSDMEQDQQNFREITVEVVPDARLEDGKAASEAASEAGIHELQKAEQQQQQQEEEKAEEKQETKPVAPQTADAPQPATLPDQPTFIRSAPKESTDRTARSSQAPPLPTGSSSPRGEAAPLGSPPSAPARSPQDEGDNAEAMRGQLSKLTPGRARRLSPITLPPSSEAATAPEERFGEATELDGQKDLREGSGGSALGSRRERASDTTRRVQVLFLLRSQPPAIAADASPAPTEAPPPAPAAEVD